MERNAVMDIAWKQEVTMPKFRFETVKFGQTTTFEEDLASAEVAHRASASERVGTSDVVAGLFMSNLQWRRN